MNPIKKTFTLGSHEVSFETGEIARQAHGAVVCTMDDTVVLATIERVTDRTKGNVKRIKTLLARQRMSADAALDLATSYAEWKQVPVVYTDSWPPLAR